MRDFQPGHSVVPAFCAKLLSPHPKKGISTTPSIRHPSYDDFSAFPFMISQD